MIIVWMLFCLATCYFVLRTWYSPIAFDSKVIASQIVRAAFNITFTICHASLVTIDISLSTIDDNMLRRKIARATTDGMVCAHDSNASHPGYLHNNAAFLFSQMIFCLRSWSYRDSTQYFRLCTWSFGFAQVILPIYHLMDLLSQKTDRLQHLINNRYYLTSQLPEVIKGL